MRTKSIIKLMIFLALLAVMISASSGCNRVTELGLFEHDSTDDSDTVTDDAGINDAGIITKHAT